MDLNKIVCACFEEFQTRMDKIEKKIDDLGKQTTDLGMACKRAFEMTKEVVHQLSEHQEELTEDISEFGGVIRDTTWNV